MDEPLDLVLERCLAVCGASSPHDAIAVALHACLLAEGYVCIATGDKNFGEAMPHLSSSPTSSAASVYNLPAGWNRSQEVYELQYHQVRSRRLCLVKMIVIEGQLLVSAMSAGNMDEVHSVTLETDKYLQSYQFTSVSAFKNLLHLVSTLNKDVVAKLSLSPSPLTTTSHPPPSSPSSSTSGREADRRGREGGYDPLRVGPPRGPGVGGIRDPLSPAGYGDADRLPFGGGGIGGGGMYFDPLRGGGLGGPQFGPTGSFPPGHLPGARFDPVTPFGGGLGPMPGRGRGRDRDRRLGDPDPDHLPPPGSDDMFL